jgi:hypothetical protein
MVRKITKYKIQFFTSIQFNKSKLISIFKKVDKSVTEKTFKFAETYNLPFYYVSAAEGTNVVRVKFIEKKKKKK